MKWDGCLTMSQLFGSRNIYINFGNLNISKILLHHNLCKNFHINFGYLNIRNLTVHTSGGKLENTETPLTVLLKSSVKDEIII